VSISAIRTNLSGDKIFEGSQDMKNTLINNELISHSEEDKIEENDNHRLHHGVTTPL
jgi:hypothetical protein